MIRKRINIQTQIDAVNQAAAQALQSAQSAIAVSQSTSTDRPLLKPTALFDFQNAKGLDYRCNFTRNSIATFIDRHGVMKLSRKNKPRFNHNPLTKECLGLLMESEKTNFLKQSNEFTSPFWLKTRVTIDSSTTKGILSSTAQKIVVTGETDPSLNQSVTISSGIANKDFVFSVYLWSDSLNQTARLLIYNESMEALQMNLVNVSDTPTRFEVNTKFGSNPSSNNIIVRIDPFDGETQNPNQGRYMYVACAQLEEGSKSSSYIPTNELSSTRNADLLQVSGDKFNSLFSEKEGTMLCVGGMGSTNLNYPVYWSLTGPNTTGGKNEIKLSKLGSNTAYGNQVFVDGVMSFGNFYNGTLGSDISNIFTWGAGKIKMVLNGVLGQETIVNTPQNINSFIINDINEHLRLLSFWPKKLSDVELISISNTTKLSGKRGNQVPSNSDLSEMSYFPINALFGMQLKQCFTIDGTGSTITRNIRFPDDFYFEIVDSSGCSITSQPSASCVANTDNALVFSAPLGKSLTYAVTPKFEY